MIRVSMKNGRILGIAIDSNAFSISRPQNAASCYRIINAFWFTSSMYWSPATCIRLCGGTNVVTSTVRWVRKITFIGALKLARYGLTNCSCPVATNVTKVCFASNATKWIWFRALSHSKRLGTVSPAYLKFFLWKPNAWKGCKNSKKNLHNILHSLAHIGQFYCHYKLGHSLRSSGYRLRVFGWLLEKILTSYLECQMTQKVRMLWQ